MNGIASDCALNILVGLFDKGATLSEPSIQIQNSDVDIFQLVGDSFFVVFNDAKLCKVKNNTSCFNIVLLLKHRQLFINLALRTPNDANIKSECRHLLTDLETNTIRSTCDYYPRVRLPISFKYIVGSSENMSVY